MIWGIPTAAALFLAAPPAPLPTAAAAPPVAAAAVHATPAPLANATPIAYHAPLPSASGCCLPPGPPMCCLVGASAPVVACEIPCCVQTVACAPATQAVAADQAEPETLPVAAEEDAALEPVAFGMPGETLFGPAPLDRMGLGWGAGNIGPGTLFPTPQRVGGSVGGFGGFGGGSPSGSNGSSSITNVINNIVNPPRQTVDPPAPVPEPGSFALWGAVAGFALWRRRRLG